LFIYGVIGFKRVTARSVFGVTKVKVVVAFSTSRWRILAQAAIGNSKNPALGELGLLIFDHFPGISSGETSCLSCWI